MKLEYVKLTYREQKVVEELVRSVWDVKRATYRDGHSDETVATAARKRLGAAVIAGNVSHVRREVGLVSKTRAAGTGLGFQHADLQRLADVLQTERRAMVSQRQDGGLYITALDTYLAQRNGMLKRKPWEQVRKHRGPGRRAHAPVVPSISPV